jgi:hypothetical protein
LRCADKIGVSAQTSPSFSGMLLVLEESGIVCLKPAGLPSDSSLTTTPESCGLNFLLSPGSLRKGTEKDEPKTNDSSPAWLKEKEDSSSGSGAAVCAVTTRGSG